MTSRRVACLLALALLLSATGRVWRAASPAPGPAESEPRHREAAAKRTAAAPFVPAARVSADAESPAPARPAVTLSPDDTALLAEQITLQQRVADCGLQLTPEQWQIFAAVSLHHQAIRHAYEATIASAAAAGERRVRMEIPAYPAAGDALRARFLADLRAGLGADVADDIASRAAAALEGHFGGFGVSVQTLDFVREPGGTDLDYSVTRTVNYWNSATAHAGAPDRLTMRREVHFPGLEDPSGYSWGPFLSVIASPAHHVGS